MIHYLRGKITHKDNKSLIIENQGVGYKVFCAQNTLKNISEGSELKIFTSLFLREDAAELYGFLTAGELELFDTLNSISGVGPKTAMMLASLGSLEKLKEMMEGGKLPSEIKGIGPKKMQKIFLELTGKIQSLKKSSQPAFDEALEALFSLGVKSAIARDALSKIPQDIENTGEKVKAALRILGRH